MPARVKKPEDFPVGSLVRFLVNGSSCPSSYTADIIQIKHGSCTFSVNMAKVMGITNTHVACEFVDTRGESVCQGFLPKDIELMTADNQPQEISREDLKKVYDALKENHRSRAENFSNADTIIEFAKEGLSEYCGFSVGQIVIGKPYPCNGLKGKIVYIDHKHSDQHIGVDWGDDFTNGHDLDHKFPPTCRWMRANEIMLCDQKAIVLHQDSSGYVYSDAPIKGSRIKMKRGYFPHKEGVLVIVGDSTSCNWGIDFGTDFWGHNLCGELGRDTGYYVRQSDFDLINPGVQGVEIKVGDRVGNILISQKVSPVIIRGEIPRGRILEGKRKKSEIASSKMTGRVLAD